MLSGASTKIASAPALTYARAPQRLVEAQYGARVGAHADQVSGLSRSAMVALIFASMISAGTTFLPAIWPQRLGQAWSSQEHRARAHALVGLHGVHGVLDVAVAVVDVDQHRNVRAAMMSRPPPRYRRSPRARYRGRRSAPGDGKAADEHAVEPGPLDQQRAQRIIAAGNDQQPLLRDGALERLAKAPRGGVVRACHDCLPRGAAVCRHALCFRYWRQVGRKSYPLRQT